MGENRDARMDTICAKTISGGVRRSRKCEHFYQDEASPEPNQGKKNRYNWRTYRLTLSNPVAAQEEKALKISAQHAQIIKPDDYYIFVPAGTAHSADLAAKQGRRATVRVTLLFCVGDQINRAGLRTYFAERDDSVLITIPGVEADEDPPAIPTPWGVGISQAQIGQLFAAAGLDADYRVEVLAAYSTGYHGMQATMLDGLVPLEHVKHVVFYDCLYAADQYPAERRTIGALAAFRDVNDKARIIVYRVTDRGTPLYHGTSGARGRIAIEDPTTIAETFVRAALIKPEFRADPARAERARALIENDRSRLVIDLTPDAPYLDALIFARLLDEGVKDSLLLANQVPPGFSALISPALGPSLLPVRGTVASTKTSVPFGPWVADAAGPVSLQSWGDANRLLIGRIGADFTRAAQLIERYSLMGWVPNKDLRAEARHDQFMAEFAWEFLAPP